MKQIITGILAHVDAGKTTLSEALLFKGGTIRSQGRVDHKNAFLDINEQERERGITIYSKEAMIDLGDAHITLLDTPGHVDFSLEMERALPAMDVAILVVSATEGIQAHTRTLWKLLGKYDIPVFVFVNKMDRSSEDNAALMVQLKKNLGEGFVDFSAVGVTQADDELYSVAEEVAMCDENLLDFYLEKGFVTKEQVGGLVSDRKLFPVYFGSALKLIGIDEFLEGLTEFTEDKTYPSEFGARVYNISRDDQGNLLTHIKVTGGSLQVKSLLDMGECEEKINQIRIYNGAKYNVVNEVAAGAVCAVTGLSKSYVGQAFGEWETDVTPVLTPILTYKMNILSGQDPTAVIPKMMELEREEPGLNVRWNKEAGEINVGLMGEVQSEILKEVIKKRFGIDVSFDKGSIIYRETVADMVYGVGHFEPLTHYAEVVLRIEPAERGEGIVIESDCSEDVLSKHWQKLILSNLAGKRHKGVLTGSLLTDVKITLTHGRAHYKHTSGGDFRQAALRAVRQGLMQAQSVLLEPFLDFELVLPSSSLGRAMSDVQNMHGTINVDDNDGNVARVTGYAPAVLIRDYHLQVVSYTKGEGKLSLSFRGYEPCHNADEVIAAKRYEPAADIKNTPDSVFCEGGAGFVVPWNQVKSYMHSQIATDGHVIKSDDVMLNTALNDNRFAGSSRRVSEYTGSYEDDKELEKIFNNTFGKKNDSKGTSNKQRLFENRPENTTSTSAAVGAAPVKEYKKNSEKAVNRDKYLLVDGYNILFAWDELKELADSNIDGARSRLMDILCNYQGYMKCKLIVVFDAYKVSGHRLESFEYNNITVVYTAHAQTADSYIEQFAHDMSGKHDICVATSDRLEQMIIMGSGCTRMSAREFYLEVERVNSCIRERINDSATAGGDTA